MSLCCGDSPESWGLAGHSLRCHWPWSLAPGGALFSSTLSSAASGPSASPGEDRRASSPLTHSKAEGYDMGSLLVWQPRHLCRNGGTPLMLLETFIYSHPLSFIVFTREPFSFKFFPILQMDTLRH